MLANAEKNRSVDLDIVRAAGLAVYVTDIRALRPSVSQFDPASLPPVDLVALPDQLAMVSVRATPG